MHTRAEKPEEVQDTVANRGRQLDEKPLYRVMVQFK